MDFDAAWRRDFGPWQLTVRLDERADLPAFALMFDQRMGADVVGDAIDDALTNEPSVDVTLRWRRWASWNPLISVHGDALFPLDQSARIGYFARAILGVAIRGQAGELIPFLSADIGNGQGMLINQHEIRFSAGVRYAAF